MSLIASSNNPLKSVVLAASGIDATEYLEPMTLLLSGDIEIGIFAPEIGSYQVIAAGHELTCLCDTTCDSFEAALIAATQFLMVEYGLECAAALLDNPDALTRA